MRVRIQRAVFAGAAVLMLAAAESGALAQDAVLRGTEPVVAQTAPKPPAPPLDAPAAPPLSDTTDVINYGKPKPKKPKLFKLYKPNPKISPPLPALVPYPTANGLRKRPATPPTPDQNNPDVVVPVPPPTVAILPPLPKPKPPVPDPDPYAPVGIHVGSLRLFPFVETGIGYDTNPNRLSSEVQGSIYNRTDAGLKLQSDWSQNSLTADLRGGYSDYFQFHEADRPDANGTITGRIDVTRDTQINTETRFTVTTQQPGSPQLAVPGAVFIVGRPLIATYGQTLGFTQNFNRLQVQLRGSFDRSDYADALQSDGTTLALSTENYNDYGLNGRIGYEITPGLMPFLQIGGDLRRHDTALDFSGFARDSDGVAAKVGSKVEFTRLLTGELSAGYTERTSADARLPKISAPTLDGTLVYTATPLTTLTLKTSTDVSETITPLASGAVSRKVELIAAHALLRDLTVTANGSFQNFNYVGQAISENLYVAGLAAEYKLNRSISVNASFSHERLTSSVPGSDYTANVFLLGLKLQR